MKNNREWVTEQSSEDTLLLLVLGKEQWLSTTATIEGSEMKTEIK